MSQHKSGVSNWTAKQKQEYWDRRNKGLRGQIGYVKFHQRVKDDKGKESLIPLGNIGSSFMSPKQQPSAWNMVRGNNQVHKQQQRKATSRGN